MCFGKTEGARRSDGRYLDRSMWLITDSLHDALRVRKRAVAATVEHVEVIFEATCVRVAILRAEVRVLPVGASVHHHGTNVAAGNNTGRPGRLIIAALEDETVAATHVHDTVKASGGFGSWLGRATAAR